MHAHELRMPAAEFATHYKDRPSGSVSKLNSFRDRFRILRTIIVLVREERRMQLFSTLAALLALASIVFLAPVVVTFRETGLVPRLPTAVLSMGLMLLSFFSLGCGLIPDTVTRGRLEMKRMRYFLIHAAHFEGIKPSAFQSVLGRLIKFF